MPRSKRTLSLLLPAAFVALTLAAAPSLAVVTNGLRTDPTDPNTAGMDTWPFTTLGNNYYGMNWNYNYQTKGGTSVAIGYFTLLTADHYYIDTVDDGTPTTYNTFLINGDTWRVASSTTLTNPDQSKADMRVLQMENLTNKYRPLPGFYNLYTGTFPSATERNFVIVGWGDTGDTYDTHYTDKPGSSGVRRWGTNNFKNLLSDYFVGGPYRGPHSTKCFRMTYSKTSTTYEAGVGVGDSGGGVFVKVGGTWKLAGINLYQIGTYPTNLTGSYAASIPYYASKLYDILQYDLLPGDLNLDGDVDSSDYITLKENFGETDATWSHDDFNDDGLVGYDDLFALMTNFGYKSNPHPIMTPPSGGSISTGDMAAVPEPGSAILLALGAAALLRRRGVIGKARR